MPASVEDLAALVARLELVASRLEGAAGSPAVTAEAASAAVAAFDGLLSGPLHQFIAISKQIGGHGRGGGILMNDALSSSNVYQL